MDYRPYVRVPFRVLACEVTEDNFDEVFSLIGKEIKETPQGKRYILIDRRIIPHGHKAQVGGWITVMDDRIRYYSKTAFQEQFVDSDDFDGYLETFEITSDPDAMAAIEEAEAETPAVPDISGADVAVA